MLLQCRIERHVSRREKVRIHKPTCLIGQGSLGTEGMVYVCLLPAQRVEVTWLNWGLHVGL
jgi:hypothetical protein